MNLVALQQGLIAMCIGMSVVLAFLIMLVGSMSVMSKAIVALNRLFPEAVPVVAAKPKSGSAVKEDEQIAAVLAAIFARK